MQSSDVPVDPHSTSVLRIFQTHHKLSGELLVESDAINRAELTLVDKFFAVMTVQNILLKS